jgi:hypothetical protein
MKTAAEYRAMAEECVLGEIVWRYCYSGRWQAIKLGSSIKPIRRCAFTQQDFCRFFPNLSGLRPTQQRNYELGS